MHDAYFLDKQQLGHYRLVSWLGSGGFAEVYSGRDIRTDQRVALKILYPHYTDQRGYLERFHREMLVLRSLPDHPNIVKLLDVGQEGRFHYLVMEYLEGCDLDQIVAGRQRLCAGEAVAIAIQVADALALAADYGIIHRDIKPGNIRLTPQGVVKVMDFGIARPADGLRITRAEEVVGTQGYIAPEVWQGQSISPATDIYSLGCVLYEMLTGQPPFPDGIMGHLSGKLDEVPLRASGATEALIEIVSSLLAKNPLHRPVAGQLARRLRDLNLAFDLQALLRSVSSDIELKEPETTRIRCDIDEAETTRVREERILSSPGVSAFFPKLILQPAFPLVDLGARTCGSVLLHGRTILAATLSGYLYQIDLVTGQRIGCWHVAPDGFISPAWPMVACGQSVYLHGGSSVLRCFSLVTGQVESEIHLQEMTLQAMLSWRDSLVLVGQQDLWRVSFDLAGAVARCTLPGKLLGRPLVSPDGVLYVPTHIGVVEVAADGACCTAQTPRPVPNLAWLAPGRLLGAAAGRGAESICTYVYLLDLLAHETTRELLCVRGRPTGLLLTEEKTLILTLHHGEIQVFQCIGEGQNNFENSWCWHAPDDMRLEWPAVLADSYLALVTSREHRSCLTFLRLDTGEEVVNQPVEDEPFSAPMICEGIVVLATDSGHVLGYRWMER